MGHMGKRFVLPMSGSDPAIMIMSRKSFSPGSAKFAKQYRRGPGQKENGNARSGSRTEASISNANRRPEGLARPDAEVSRAAAAEAFFTAWSLGQIAVEASSQAFKKT